MKNKKVLITIIIALIIAFLFISNSYAAGSFSASLTPSNSRVSKGSEVSVTFKVSGINVEGGINAISATLDYDTDVLTIKKDDVSGLNGWNVEFNEDTLKLVADSSTPIEEDTEILKFTFEVAENTSATTTSIKLKSIEAGNSSLDTPVKISDITTNISFGTTINPTTSSTPTPTPTAETTQTPEPTTTATTTPTASTQPSNTTTKANETTPYTGTENYVLPLMAVIAILGIVSFVNYKKIDE